MATPLPQVSNEKLFHRAVGLVQLIAQIEDEKLAKDFLLKSIYGTDELSSLASRTEEEEAEENPSRHVERASKLQRVVPTAIVMATSWQRQRHSDGIVMATAGMSFNETKTFLYREPILRRALLQIRSPSENY